MTSFPQDKKKHGPLSLHLQQVNAGLLQHYSKILLTPCIDCHLGGERGGGEREREGDEERDRRKEKEKN